MEHEFPSRNTLLESPATAGSEHYAHAEQVAPRLASSPSDARTSPGFFELTRNAVPALEVHFIRRLPIERSVRKNAIMLVDVEDDQALEGRQVVEMM